MPRKKALQAKTQSPSVTSSDSAGMIAIANFIVGIGASAGGLAAFEAFFHHLPADSLPSMAIVVVQHLAPDHTSLLCSLIQRYTQLPVCEVEDGMSVQSGHVYIIPPNKDLALFHDRFQLLDITLPRSVHLPIDHFFFLYILLS